MDGPSKYHDRYRVDCEGEGTWKRVLDTADLLKNAGVEFSVEDTAEVQKVEMKDEVPTALLIINKKGQFLDNVYQGLPSTGPSLCGTSVQSWLSQSVYMAGSN